MTTGPDPDNPDTEGKAVPPYEERQQSGEPRPPLPMSDEVDDADETPGGTSDEQPASESTDDGENDQPESTGPGHTPGTGRAED